MPLQLLNDTEVSEYVASLDLADGSEAKRTVGAMMLLPPPAFTRAISAVAQGLITFHSLRSLPAMNERLVDSLIANRLGETDATALAWRYGSEWLPASIDVRGMKVSAIGPAKAAVAARFIDRWGGIIRPPYDFLGIDETKYHSYNEAVNAYMIAAVSEPVHEQISNFRTAHAQLRSSHSSLLQPSDADCPLLSLVESLATEPMFLERADGGRATLPILEWLMSTSWRNVEPGNFSKFMRDVAQPAMAASTDLERNGLPGAIAVFAAHPWSPITATSPGWTLDLARMSRVHLPAAYGNAFPGASDLFMETDRAAALLTYIEAAYSSISQSFTVIQNEVISGAAKYRAKIGSPVGLLLTITKSN